MPKITFITTENKEIVIEESGGNLMEIAKMHDVPGIEGDCGGVCSCSTCHVYVDAEWAERVGQPDEIEEDTLEFDSRRKSCSRLGCQVELTEDLDGLVVRVAPAE